jgi:hypothetical protein
MKESKTTFVVTGTAPARSLMEGETVSLGKFNGLTEAERCKEFYSLHYDNVVIQRDEKER